MHIYKGQKSVSIHITHRHITAPCTSQQTRTELFSLEARRLMALKGNEGLQGGSRWWQHRQWQQGKGMTPSHRTQEWRVSGPGQKDHTSTWHITHATGTKMVTVIYLSQHIQSRPPPPRWDLAVINLYLKLRELIVLRSRCDSCFFWGQLILPQKSHCGYSPITARKLQSLYTFLFTLHLLSCMKEVQFMSLFGVSYQLHSFCSNLANRILKMPRQTPSRFWHVKYPLWKQLSTITSPPRSKLKLQYGLFMVPFLFNP